MEKSTPQWLDVSTLQMLAELGDRRGKDLLGQLYGLFKTQGPSGIADLRNAITAADAGAFADAAHSLKGSYRSLGTPRLAEIASEMETAGRAGHLEDAAAMVDALEVAFHRTDEALGSFVESQRRT